MIVSIMIPVCGLLWFVIQCILVYYCRRFSGTCYHIFMSQDGGSKSLLIIIIHQINPTAAHPRTRNQMRARFQKKQELSLWGWARPLRFLTYCLKHSKQHEVYGRIDKDHSFVVLRTLLRVCCEDELSWNYMSQGESVFSAGILEWPSPHLTRKFNPYNANNQLTTITYAYVINKFKYMLTV
jgi:hypothetical protein